MASPCIASEGATCAPRIPTKVVRHRRRGGATRPRNLRPFRWISWRRCCCGPVRRRSVSDHASDRRGSVAEVLGSVPRGTYTRPMKIFVSSVISGFEQYRAAAVDAIRALGYDVIRAEDFAASTRSPQVACMTGIREADLVLLILGERYGAVQTSGKSATHEEYEEAKGRKPILVFVQDKVAMEPRQVAFRQEVEQWQGGHLWKSFA